jgi:hypothetical protein
MPDSEFEELLARAAQEGAKRALADIHCGRPRRHRGDDLRPPRRLAPGAAVIAALLGRIAASPWIRAALRYGAIVFAVLLFLLLLRRSGERAGRLAERLETTEKVNDVQRQMLQAAARRPRDRDELAERLHDGRF